MVDALVLVSVAVLGIAAGALIAEGAILVPFWRGLAPRDFLDWYAKHADLLLRFFGPLEVAAVLMPALAVAGVLSVEAPGLEALAVATGASVLVVASFPLYFQRANASFASGEIAPEDVAAELRRWSLWHWGRTAIAVLAFIAAIVAALGF
ncbi:MAG: hypothetical protein AAF430_05535 [Myxococcota bacterium]